MKKTLLLALALAAISILPSCKKDPIPNDNGQGENPSDTINSGNDTIVPWDYSKIIFGDTTDMDIIAYNSVMEFDESWQPFLLDLDGDGQNDIKIETYYDGPLAIGEFQELTLHCMNSHTEILADSIVKESYSHNETTTDTLNGYVIITHKYIYSTCGKIAEDDPVHTSKVFETNANELNDPCSIDNNFLCGKSTLFKEDIEYSLADPGEEIIEVNYNKSIYGCWNFPTDAEKYIGFKITTNGGTRLGWLKIKLETTWGGSVANTRLLETAIQKQS